MTKEELEIIQECIDCDKYCIRLWDHIKVCRFGMQTVDDERLLKNLEKFRK